MFLEKYMPNAISGMIGNRVQAGEFKRAIAAWERGSAIVLSGTPGCGKTLAVALVAKEFGLEVVNGSLNDLLAASSQTSLWSKGKILVGDVDTDLSVRDADKLIEDSKWPVVFMTGDIYLRELLELRKDRRVKIIAFQKIGASDIAGFIAAVCKSEGIACDERAAYELAQRSDGDARWALIALESLQSVNRDSINDFDKDRVEKIFTVLDAVFQRRQLAGADANEFFSWIVENLPEKYGGMELAHAYRCAASAGRFQRFGLDKHSQELIGLMPASRYMSQYKTPRWVGSGGAKIDGAHCSAKKAKAYTQLLNSLQRSKSPSK